MKNETEYYKTIVSIAAAFGVHRNSVRQWMESDWWPQKKAQGWLKTEVQSAIEEYEANRDGMNEDGGYVEGTKEEKTALECKRLKILIEKERELLDQAREQTRQMIEEGQKASGKLIEKSEVEAGMVSFFAELRSVIESWAKTAKADYPQHHEVFTKAVKLYLERLNEGL